MPGPSSADDDRDWYSWHDDRGFDRLWVSDPRSGYGVGVHVFTGTPAPLAKDAVMFAFTRTNRNLG